MIRVVVADDHPPLREGVKQALDGDRGIQIVAEAGSGPELMVALQSNPDVLLLDISMPQFDIFQTLPRLQAEYPKLKIVIVTAHDHEAFVQRLLKEVQGYVLKDEDMHVYAAAVHKVHNGGTYYSDRALAVVLKSPELPKLTARELSVLTLAAQGLRTVDIAQRLYISTRTVDTHIESACLKLGVSNRTAAVAKALDLNLISTQGTEG